MAQQDDCGRVRFNGGSENFPRMDERRARGLRHNEVVPAYCAVAMDMEDNETSPLRIEAQISEDGGSPMGDCPLGLTGRFLCGRFVFGFWNMTVGQFRVFHAIFLLGRPPAKAGCFLLGLRLLEAGTAIGSKRDWEKERSSDGDYIRGGADSGRGTGGIV
jgi:hypothetical protein